MRRQSANALVVFVCGGPVVGKLLMIDLVGIAEDICWMGELIELVFYDLAHLLEF